ncbi:MAG: patatin-like phospholipase family protein [Marmoricola sp.]
MTTAFVLSGGASLAAVQVGMLQALAARDIGPDLLVGTSAGALNAAFVAGHGYDAQSLDRLASLWVGMRRSEIFPLRAPHALLAVLGRRPSLCSPDRLAALLADQLPFSALEDALIPLHLVATDLLSGRDSVLTRGDAVSALLASAAIPGVFPAVEREGRVLCDGALASGSAIRQAVEAGADRVYLLPGGTSCALQHAPRHPLAASLHAVTLLLAQRAFLEAQMYAPHIELHVLPPLCPLAISGADFSHAAELIARGTATAGAWLDAGHDRAAQPEEVLTLHRHRAADPQAVRS